MLRIDVKRTPFYKELTEEKQKEYFEQTKYKILPNIDNVYYSVSLKEDENDNPKLRPLLERLVELKQLVRESKTVDSIPFLGDLSVYAKSFNMYAYCVSNTDLYDIFVSDYLQNEKTPRCHVQIRSYGLWMYGYKSMVEMSFASVEMLFAHYDMQIDRVMENRIDYCYHTNIIQNMQSSFSDKTLERTMKTNLRKHGLVGGIIHHEDRIEMRKETITLGQRKSNNVYVRLYNKALEVIEEGYKSYFFGIWRENGLTNLYDNFCFEYAYKAKRFEHIHRAKLEFYILYGKDEKRKQECREKLENVRLNSTDIQKYAKEFMPECTTIMNIEFQTKRKFYYYSDEFIENVLCVKFAAQVEKRPLLRLMTLFYNRQIFLDYLTSASLRFVKIEGEKEVYTDWWLRLRTVKLADVSASNEKLLRKYCQELDLEVMKSRYVNTVATLSVYMRKELENTFVDDYMDIFSLLNDNDKQGGQKYMLLTDTAEIITQVENMKLVYDYRLKKIGKENKLKNRLEGLSQ